MRISALARMRESRPSAATARAARTASPSAKVRQAVSPPPSKAMAVSGRIVRRGSSAAAAARRDTSRLFSTFQPKASRPISPAENETGGGRNRLPVSSMMRMTASGAASAARAGQTPSACRKRTDPSRSAIGAAVVARLGTADESRGEALARESERRGETGRPGADDGDVEILSHRYRSGPDLRCTSGMAAKASWPTRPTLALGGRSGASREAIDIGLV